MGDHTPESDARDAARRAAGRRLWDQLLRPIEAGELDIAGPTEDVAAARPPTEPGDTSPLLEIYDILRRVAARARQDEQSDEPGMRR